MSPPRASLGRPASSSVTESPEAGGGAGRGRGEEVRMRGGGEAWGGEKEGPPRPHVCVCAKACRETSQYTHTTGGPARRCGEDSVSHTTHARARTHTLPASRRGEDGECLGAVLNGRSHRRRCEQRATLAARCMCGGAVRSEPPQATLTHRHVHEQQATLPHRHVHEQQATLPHRHVHEQQATLPHRHVHEQQATLCYHTGASMSSRRRYAL
jgi:hypothetical protein